MAVAEEVVVEAESATFRIYKMQTERMDGWMDGGRREGADANGTLTCTCLQGACPGNQNPTCYQRRERSYRCVCVCVPAA